MAAPDYADEIAGLRAAMASGELTVESNGERVTYRSMADIRAALGYFEGMAADASAAPRVRSGTTLATFEGG